MRTVAALLLFASAACAQTRITVTVDQPPPQSTLRAARPIVAAPAPVMYAVPAAPAVVTVPAVVAAPQPVCLVPVPYGAKLPNGKYATPTGRKPAPGVFESNDPATRALRWMLGYDPNY